MSWSTPPTFVGLATSAMFNILRDCLNSIGDPWTTYTPVVSSSGTAPTMGASTVAGRFRSNGKTADIQIEITLGASFSAGSGQYNFSLPSGMSPIANGASSALGVGAVRDVSGPAAHGTIVYFLSSTSVGMLDSTTGTPVGAATPFTWATGDRWSVNIRGLEVA